VRRVTLWRHVCGRSFQHTAHAPPGHVHRVCTWHGKAPGRHL